MKGSLANGHIISAFAAATVGQAQVAAQDVDALLAAQSIGFVGHTGHGVDPHDDASLAEEYSVGRSTIHRIIINGAAAI